MNKYFFDQMIKFFSKHSIIIVDDVSDVAIVIKSLLEQSSNKSNNNNIKNEIFNIGFDVNLTVNKLYQKMAYLINSNFELNIIQTDNKEIDHPFPSVNKSISIDKIKRFLNFQPTCINQALSETIQFYKNAYSKFPNEMKSIEKCLRKEFLKKDQYSSFKTFIDSKI